MVILIDKENNKPSDFFFFWFIQGMGVILSSYLSLDKWFSNQKKKKKPKKKLHADIFPEVERKSKKLTPNSLASQCIKTEIGFLLWEVPPRAGFGKSGLRAEANAGDGSSPSVWEGPHLLPQPPPGTNLESRI